MSDSVLLVVQQQNENKRLATRSSQRAGQKPPMSCIQSGKRRDFQNGLQHKAQFCLRGLRSLFSLTEVNVIIIFLVHLRSSAVSQSEKMSFGCEYYFITELLSFVVIF